MKHVKLFEQFLNEAFNDVSGSSIANELMKGEAKWRERQKLVSADLIWSEKKTRQKFMIAMDDLVKNIGIDKIKSQSKRIIDELNDEGFIVLSHFLILRKYVDSPAYKHLSSKAKNSLDDFDDKEAFIDFMNEAVLNRTPESLIGEELVLVDDMYATPNLKGNSKKHPDNIIIKKGEKIKLITARFPNEPKAGVIEYKGKEYTVNVDPMLNKTNLVKK